MYRRTSPVYTQMARLMMLGFDEALAYIHDYMINNPPFDVSPPSLKHGKELIFRESWVSPKEHVWQPSSLHSYAFLPLSWSRARTDFQLLNQNAHPSFPPHPSLQAPKFLISVGGFLPVPREPDLSHLFPIPASLPTLHVVGRNDIVVTEEKSRTLWEKCETSRVEYHDGGMSLLPSPAILHLLLRSQAVRLTADCQDISHHRRHLGATSSSELSNIQPVPRLTTSAYISSFGPEGSQGDVGPPASFGPSGANTPAASGTPRSGSPSRL